MVRYSLLVDHDACIGCRACELACKQENRIPVGAQWIRVVQVGPMEVGGKMVMRFVPSRCRHCGKPPCIDACPEGAITRRDDGVVLIDPETCVGCKECIEVCPFGAPQIDPETGSAGKCTLCMHRIDQGLKPACVLACPTRAITFGDINHLGELKRGKVASCARPSS